MAEIKLEHPVREVHGAFTKKGIINRQKKYRDDTFLCKCSVYFTDRVF